MNKYYLYKIDTGENKLYEYKCPRLKDKVNIDESKLVLKEIKDLDFSDYKGLRNAGLINEYYFNLIELNFTQYFIATPHKDRYYSNQLKLKNGRLVGSLPCFWTSFKYAMFLTIYLIIYIYLSYKLIDFIFVVLKLNRYK